MLSDPTTDKFSVWKYNINGGPLTVSTMPTKVADHLSPPNGNTFADMDRGEEAILENTHLRTSRVMFTKQRR